MFKIQMGGSAILDHQMKKEVAKPVARQLLREKSAGAIAEVDGEGSPYVKGIDLKNSWWNGRIDMKEAIGNSKKYMKDYERTLPEKLSPQVEDKMWIRAKQLKDEFVFGMLSREELHPVKGFLDNGTMKWVVDEEKMRNNRSVERESQWQKNNSVKIQEFKNIMRHLDSDNPNAGDVERFRPQKAKIKNV